MVRVVDLEWYVAAPFSPIFRNSSSSINDRKLIPGSFYFLRLGPFSRLLKLQTQHLRLTLNSLALSVSAANGQLKLNSDASSSVDDLSQYIRMGTTAALEVIQLFGEKGPSERTMNMCYANDVGPDAPNRFPAPPTPPF